MLSVRVELLRMLVLGPVARIPQRWGISQSVEVEILVPRASAEVLALVPTPALLMVRERRVRATTVRTPLLLVVVAATVRLAARMRLAMAAMVRFIGGLRQPLSVMRAVAVAEITILVSRNSAGLMAGVTVPRPEQPTLRAALRILAAAVAATTSRLQVSLRVAVAVLVSV